MAIAPSIYHVRYSDWTVSNTHEIVIQPSTVDNSTTLTLPGSGKLDYGQFWDQNALFLMEHFAKDSAPVNPVQGQIWFHKTEKKLRLYDLSNDPNFNNWSSIQQTRYGTVHPSTPNTGDFFYNVGTNIFEYWDGTIWQTILNGTVANATYVLKAGDTMTGDLNMDGTHKVTGLAAPTVASDATNKTYVDTADNLRVLKAGDTMTGFLTLSANPANPLHAATKQYVDNADALKVSKSGDTMSGDLTINKNNPTLNLTGPNGTNKAINTYTAGVSRWGFGTDSTNESGSNAGSNFVITRYTDAGSAIDLPLSINRATGRVTIGSAQTGAGEAVTGNSLNVIARVLVLDSSAFGNAPTDLMLNGTGSASKYISYRTNGSGITGTGFRFTAGVTDVEVGGNSGSNYFIDRYNDAGSPISRALTINRQTGDFDIYGNITFQGGLKRIHNLADPAAPQDAATQNYVGAALSFYTAFGFSHSFAGNGYQYLPSGHLEQWGIYCMGGGPNDQTITFPIAFPNAVLNIQMTNQENYPNEGNFVRVRTWNNSSFFFSNGGGNTFTCYFWRAVGY